ncbi:D-alanyl-D-alanine carboxypeptidase family protein [Cellulomonas cellasea]|uniref:D-alanyl-D-alanine dipeptidase n=1 Tax=Cellulomonas cellasea TaxID=43670 RepID=A0A7W4YAG4_9CELL|nr:M15 family metallopeptidase [Cellulomonas cellasea]MBB2921757.1 D-alanyl-D-alanine dipeptidase [Cellulomonas cellasea]
MDGITAITQRMAAIQATVATLAPPAPKPAATAASATAFGAVLDQAVARTAPAPAPAAATKPAAVFVDGVPADLAPYGNGRVPADALEPVGSTGHKLWAPAAGALEDVLAAAARDGVTIGITDSYRSFDAQVDVAQRKGLYSQGGLAAKPGTSPHGWGLAVDLKLDATAQAWMRANGGRFGFVEDTPREPWHWVYRG